MREARENSRCYSIMKKWKSERIMEKTPIEVFEIKLFLVIWNKLYN